MNFQKESRKEARDAGKIPPIKVNKSFSEKIGQISGNVLN
jgi:hypothetical protein